nr:hypothetical protein [Solirubrobacterales bacterium]
RGRTGAAAALGAGIVTALLALPAVAQGLTVSGTAAPANLQAGANSNFTININFGPAGEDVKDLVVGLPPGQIGDPQATPLCTLAQLNSATPGNDGCPANTQVGSVSVNASITIVVLPVPVTVTGKLFNLVPQPGEPARFGIVLQPGTLGGMLPPPGLPLDPVILQSGAVLRTSDFGLDTVINDIPNQTDGLPTHINSQTITLFGTAPGTGKPFSRNPTQCTPKTVTFSATPYTGAAGTGSAPPYTPTNCAAVPFSPEFTAKLGAPGFTGPSTKPPITTSIKQSADEAGIQDTVVFLPGVLGADPVLFTSACDIALFNAGTCPDIAVIGSATAATPLLSVPLQGPVAIVSEPGNPVPKLGLDLRGSLPLKLTGSFILSGGTGVQFQGLPDIPISNFELRFRENTLATSSVDLCKPPAPTFSTSFIAYSGATQSGPTAATVEGCVPPRPPSVKVKVKGRGEKPTLKLVAAAGSSKLREIKLKLPKSLGFGDAQAFDKGLKSNITGGKAFITNGARKLKVTLPGGADKVVVKVGKGGVVRKGDGKPRFRVQVLDVDDTRTSLTLPKGKKKK